MNKLEPLHCVTALCHCINLLGFHTIKTTEKLVYKKERNINVNKRKNH